MARFWMQVVELINFRLQLALPVTPGLLLLSIHDDEKKTQIHQNTHMFSIILR